MYELITEETHRNKQHSLRIDQLAGTGVHLLRETTHTLSFTSLRSYGPNMHGQQSANRESHIFRTSMLSGRVYIYIYMLLY